MLSITEIEQINQKLNPELALSLSLDNAKRMESSLLHSGFSPSTDMWKLILFYNGSLEEIKEMISFSFIPLLGNFAILFIKEKDIPSGVSSIVCCDIIVLTICCTNVLEVITIRTIAISIFFIKRSKRQTLIPISQNPRTSIHISKIRMPVIYPGIKNSNRCPFASKCCSIYISSSHNIIIRKTRSINSCKRIYLF